MKKQDDGALPSLAFKENPDILKSISALKTGRPKLVVGFAAETENLLDNAKAKLAKKGCDIIVANDVSAENNVFGGKDNTVSIVSNSTVENWPKLSKSEVAERLMDYLAKLQI